MNPRLNSGTLQTYYNDITILNFLKKNLKKLNGTILDIGCGKMKYKELLLSNNNIKEYKGLDLEEGKFTYSVKADIYWDGEKMPIENESIDSAILFEVLEHCPDPKILIKESYRVMKKNGLILFSTPFIYHLHGSPFDYNRPTPFLLEKLFKDLGFSQVNIIKGGSWDASLAQMIAIWICNRPMNSFVRKIIKKIYIPIFKILLKMDNNHLELSISNGTITPNVFGIAIK